MIGWGLWMYESDFFFLSFSLLEMRFIVALFAVVALAAGLLVMSDDSDGFKVLTDGSRAIFSFRDSNWDAVFGTISLREMNDKLNAVLGKVSTLEQDLNATRAELNANRAELNATRAELNASRAEFDAFKAQQAVGCL